MAFKDYSAVLKCYHANDLKNSVPFARNTVVDDKATNIQRWDKFIQRPWRIILSLGDFCTLPLLIFHIIGWWRAFFYAQEQPLVTPGIEVGCSGQKTFNQSFSRVLPGQLGKTGETSNTDAHSSFQSGLVLRNHSLRPERLDDGVPPTHTNSALNFERSGLVILNRKRAKFSEAILCSGKRALSERKLGLRAHKFDRLSVRVLRPIHRSEVTCLGGTKMGE